PVRVADAPLRALGILIGRVVLDSGNALGVGVGLVGLRAGIRELVSAGLEQSSDFGARLLWRTLLAVARVDRRALAPIPRRIRADRGPVRQPGTAAAIPNAVRGRPSTAVPVPGAERTRPFRPDVGTPRVGAPGAVAVERSRPPAGVTSPPFDAAQRRPFDSAQGRPFDAAQGR